MKKRINYWWIMVVFMLVGAGWYGWRTFGRGLKPIISPTPALPIETAPSNQKKAEVASQADELGLRVPNGMRISVFARDLGAPRVLLFDSRGHLLVSVPERGVVYALPDTDEDGVADRQVTVVSGLNRPHGLEIKCENDECDLYVAETDVVSRYDYSPDSMSADNRLALVDLPSGGRHWSRTLLFDPSDANRLLVSIGSSCDTCVEADDRRAAIMQIALPSGELIEYARGLRNSVFMRVNPSTNQVWATEMGRDFLGDNLPPEEVNVIELGGHYGWPYCYGNRVHDDQFDPRNEREDFCQTTLEPRITFQAHSAPLGLTFAPARWPSEFAGDLLVAQHGSWNRAEPVGYQIVRFGLDGNGQLEGESLFISGWLKADTTASGRPVDVIISPNDELFISDDKAGVIYRSWF